MSPSPSPLFFVLLSPPFSSTQHLQESSTILISLKGTDQDASKPSWHVTRKRKKNVLKPEFPSSIFLIGMTGKKENREWKNGKEEGTRERRTKKLTFAGGIKKQIPCLQLSILLFQKFF
jgi:hypothetical protein